MFQSLGRDSVGLDWDTAWVGVRSADSFNPSVGILLVWTVARRDATAGDRDRFNPSVGILLVWTAALVGIDRTGTMSFNPSVGILLVWTINRQSAAAAWEEFQSLGRDSVGLDVTEIGGMNVLVTFQSLGRDSVGLDWDMIDKNYTHRVVSIPRSGFCWFGLARWMSAPPRRWKFQSLGRDSVGLDVKRKLAME